MNSIFIRFFLILASTSSESSSENIVYPDDAGVIDVTRAPYNAVPDDGLDDAPAIQRALNEHHSGTHVFNFPNGIYDIGSSLLKLAAGHRTASVVSNPCQHVSMSAAWKTKRDNQPAV